jgi:hypothetical protein
MLEVGVIAMAGLAWFFEELEDLDGVQLMADFEDEDLTCDSPKPGVPNPLQALGVAW